MPLLEKTRDRREPAAPAPQHPTLEWIIIIACIVGVVWFISKYIAGGRYSGSVDVPLQTAQLQ
jgi:hypothetical protein